MENVKFVMINGVKYSIEGEVSSLEEVKASAVEMEPSLSNADAVIEGDTIVFKFRAGTKGLDVKEVVVGNRRYAIEEGIYSSPEQIKTALVEEAHPELSNSDYVISSDGVMTFVQRAGTKGC